MCTTGLYERRPDSSVVASIWFIEVSRCTQARFIKSILILDSFFVLLGTKSKPKLAKTDKQSKNSLFRSRVCICDEPTGGVSHFGSAVASMCSLQGLGVHQVIECGINSTFLCCHINQKPKPAKTKTDKKKQLKNDSLFRILYVTIQQER